MPLHQKRFAMQTPFLFSNRLVDIMKKSAQLLLEDPGGLQLDLFLANVQLPFKSSNRSNTGHPNGTSQTARQSGNECYAATNVGFWQKSVVIGPLNEVGVLEALPRAI